jgi:four helix bundle protein
MLVVTDIYAVTTNFPTSEIYTLTQLRRSAISIQNIAEEFGDKGLKII